MARKGNQQKNGLDRNSSNQKIKVSDTLAGSLKEKKERESCDGKDVVGEKLPNGSPSMQRRNKKNSMGEGNGSKQRFKETPIEEKPRSEKAADVLPSASVSSNPKELSADVSTLDDALNFSGSGPSLENPRDNVGSLDHGLRTKTVMEGFESIATSFGETASFILKVVNEWVERKKPLLNKMAALSMDTRDYVRIKILQAYPVVSRWLLHFGNILLLVSLVWLDCCLRGLGSFIRLGTTSFFAVIWCSILSVIAMIGILKFLLIMIVAVLLAIFVGFALAILVTVLSATVCLWVYGSFWTTGFVVAVGGLGFALKSEKFALLVTTIYSAYCARAYVGWLGFLLALNLSFISSDVLIHFLKSNVNERNSSNRGHQQTPDMQGQQGNRFAETMNGMPAETVFGKATDRSTGEPSTSGTDAELTSEEEVIRLLNCTDHYSALGLSRYESIDLSFLKREYRKKAMLVHPDKNMGDENAAEAFKKLQNAYEVLLDSLKREAYNDELRKEELLNLFRMFQSSSQVGSKHPEGDGRQPFGDLRRISCKKCRKFHIWIPINRSKSQARWCQECNDFHQAKDGDGWVEQTSRPFLFGMMQKVEAPIAYVCAESRIYDATEWFICQGMRCSANSHKPSFHVNAGVTSKAKGSGGGSGQKWGGMPSAANMDENMTEEEFLEWLQNAMQSGIFEAAAAAAGGNPQQPPPPTPDNGKNFTKNGGSSGGNTGGGSSTKKKKKGKKW